MKSFLLVVIMMISGEPQEVTIGKIESPGIVACTNTAEAMEWALNRQAQADLHFEVECLPLGHST